jgi:hypothetical protein
MAFIARKMAERAWLAPEQVPADTCAARHAARARGGPARPARGPPPADSVGG